MTDRPPPNPPNLHAFLEHWAHASPDAPAVEDCAGSALTYAQLDALASRIAHRLHDAGVRKGDRVGVCMPKCVNAVASIFGVLKAGAVYVPTDFSSPPQRNRLIYTNCQARAILTDEARRDVFTGPDAPDAEVLAFPGQAPDAVGAPWLGDRDPAWRSHDPPGPDDLAYILYTSGSTGVPKGVMHTHASAMSFVRWAADTLAPVPADRFSSHAPFHFDLSVLDLYVPTTAGARVVVIGEQLGKNPHELAPFIADRRITRWYSVPSILTLMVQFGRLDRLDCSALRTVCFAGEVFPIRHFHALMDLWPDKEYLNLYGPTETNVCTFYRVGPQDRTRDTPLPIGVPCSNVRARVVHDDFSPVDPGEEGVLYIHRSGPTMVGYWGDEQRTRASFHTDADGQRWYCTGDVVIPDDQGLLTFVGRRDRMVKRHGYRIELGEIEAGLYRHPDIREAAAVATATDAGTVITAFVSPHQGKRLSIIALKRYCASALPAYMSPDRFTFLDALPRTSTDKVDYPALRRAADRALTAPDAGR